MHKALIAIKMLPQDYPPYYIIYTFLTNVSFLTFHFCDTTYTLHNIHTNLICYITFCKTELLYEVRITYLGNV